MEMQLTEQIEVLKNVLRKKFAVKQILVFDSYAYGVPDENSDIDLCVITDLDDRRKIDIIREIRRELMDLISNPLDILVYSEEEFRRSNKT